MVRDAAGGADLKAAMVGLGHGHSGTLNPAAPGGLLGTLRQLPGVRLVAICEPDEAAVLARESAFAPELGAFRDADALLAGADFDLAVVAAGAEERAAVYRNGCT